MVGKVSQAEVNQKCELLKSQFEDITIEKVRRLIAREVSMIELTEKVMLFKQDIKKAKEIASTENLPQQPKKDELSELLQQTLAQYNVDNKDLEITLRNKFTQYIDFQITEQTHKLRNRVSSIANKKGDLEVNNIILERRYQEVLEKYNSLKEESYQLKQDMGARAMRHDKVEQYENSLLKWEDFKTVKEQFLSHTNSAKVATYAKAGFIAIKFPESDPLRNECAKGTSRYLQAKTEYDYSLQAWKLTEFADIPKTLNFLKRNKFVFSKELETVEYRLQQRKA